VYPSVSKPLTDDQTLINQIQKNNDSPQEREISVESPQKEEMVKTYLKRVIVTPAVYPRLFEFLHFDLGVMLVYFPEPGGKS